MLTLPPLDLKAAFHARFTRLHAALADVLKEDLDNVVVIPQAADSATHSHWVRRLTAERRGRTHLTPTWQSITLLPGDATTPAPPWTFQVGLDLLVEGLDTIAEGLADELRFCVDTFVVDKKLRAAVLARPDVVKGWPRPRREISAAAFALHALTSAVQVVPENEHPPSHHIVGTSDDGQPILFYYWPLDTAPGDVARWARKGMSAVGDAMMAEVSLGKIPSDVVHAVHGKPMRIPAAGLAVLYLAERAVIADSRKPAIAIDSGKVHHGLVGGMRDWPKDGKRHRGGEILNAPIRTEEAVERVELFSQGNAVQLHLPLPELDGMQDHAVQALRRLRGPKGLRHWAALLRLFSVEGGRSGTYRWLLNEHLAAMGYDERQIRDPKVRAEAAAEVEALASLELALYTEGGVLRERRRLLLETGRFERLVGSEYRLDGIEFQMNQRVYGGVRATTGEIGAKWMPAPVELATIDHVRFAYAHGLGMLLAIRFRWRLDEKADHVALAGDNLLRMAGIEYVSSKAGYAWDKLKRSLDVLQKVGQIDHYTWSPENEVWSLAGICRIYAAAWTLDRTARGVIPDERPPDKDRPVTGAELKRWRSEKGWSQEKASEQLKVRQTTISRAEARPEEPLGHKLRAAFENRTSLDEPTRGHA